MTQGLYYHLKDSGLELDFLIRQKGECVPVKVKAKTAKAKSLATAIKNKSVYHLDHAIKFGDYNVGREDYLLTLPTYMEFLLEFEGVEDINLPALNIDEVNRLSKDFLKEE